MFIIRLTFFSLFLSPFSFFLLIFLLFSFYSFSLIFHFHLTGLSLGHHTSTVSTPKHFQPVLPTKFTGRA
jgi:hypothetical protein